MYEVTMLVNGNVVRRRVMADSEVDAVEILQEQVFWTGKVHSVKRIG